MPKAFDDARKKPGAKVRTVTKGPNKGRLIVILPNGDRVLGEKRGHKKGGR